MAANQYKPLQPPYTFYLAAANTVKPAFAYTTADGVKTLSEPVAAWVKVGGSTSTDDGEIGSDAISFKIGRTFEKQPPPINDVYSYRAYLTAVEISLSYKFRDFNAEGFAKMLGDQDITTTNKSATAPAISEMDFDFGTAVGHTALLVRGMSTSETGEILPRQWWFPLTYNGASIEHMLSKTWAEFEVMWEVLKSRSQGVGEMTWATALPS